MSTPSRKLAAKRSLHHSPIICGGGFKSEKVHARPVMWVALLLATITGLTTLQFHQAAWAIYPGASIPVFLLIALWSRLRQKPKDIDISDRSGCNPHNLY